MFSCYFFFFLMVNFYFLIHEVIAQFSIPTAELAMYTEVSINEVNADIETESLTAEMKIRKYTKSFKTLYTFLYFSLIKSLSFISSKR